MDIEAGELRSVQEIWNILCGIGVSKLVALQALRKALNESVDRYMFFLDEYVMCLTDDETTLEYIWFTNGSQLTRRYVNDYSDLLLLDAYTFLLHFLYLLKNKDKKIL